MANIYVYQPPAVAVVAVAVVAVAALHWQLLPAASAAQVLSTALQLLTFQ